MGPRPLRWGEPRISPLHADAADLAGLPRTVVVTCEHDPLRDQGEAFADRLRAAGVAVTARREPGMVHNFMLWDLVSPACAAAADRVAVDSPPRSGPDRAPACTTRGWLPADDEPGDASATVTVVDVTTVADDLIEVHDGAVVHRLDGLRPATTYDVDGISVTTLARPGGELLCRFGTVNDVHFGEVEAGRIDDDPHGPIVRVADGEAPYPETMNHAAVDEMAHADLAAVVVKGDLSTDGTADEWAAFEACYRHEFGERLHAVRGNHDGYRMQDDYSGDEWIELPGIAVALLDTVIPGQTTGRLTAEQVDWLDDRAAGSDRPVFVMGHHQQWVGRRPQPGLLRPQPRRQRRARRRGRPPTSIVAYAAGHTHRHRVRLMPTAHIATIEVGCVKDFPGTWAEYRVYEGGIMQVVHRISSPAALAWSERCRHLYADFGVDYAAYTLGELPERCFNLSWRSSSTAWPTSSCWSSIRCCWAPGSGSSRGRDARPGFIGAHELGVDVGRRRPQHLHARRLRSPLPERHGAGSGSVVEGPVEGGVHVEGRAGVDREVGVGLLDQQLELGAAEQHAAGAGVPELLDHPEHAAAGARRRRGRARARRRSRC